MAYHNFVPIEILNKILDVFGDKGNHLGQIDMANL